MTWLEFNTLVRNFLTSRASTLNAQTFIDQQIRSAVIDLQSFVSYYRTGHTTTFGVDDVTEHGQASVADMPATSIIQDIYFVDTGSTAVRQPIFQYPWGNRFDLVAGNMGACQFAVAIDPLGKKLILFPKITAGRQLEVFWNGIKSDFSDTDEVPFDSNCSDTIAAWVEAKICRHIDHDIEAHNSLMGTYLAGRTRLYLDGRDRGRVHLVEASPQTAAVCLPNNVNDDTIEFLAFGSFGVGSADELAVASLAKSLDPDFILFMGGLNFPDGATETFEANLLSYYSGYIPDDSYPVWGEAELGTSEDGQDGKPTLDLWPAVADINESKLYYNFVKGEVEFFVLNGGYSDADPREPDGITAASDQHTWFAAALAASTATWKIVLIGRAPYTSDADYTPGSTDLQWDFTGVDLVITGEPRVYERILLAGVQYLNIGTGGDTLAAFDVTPVAGSQLRYATKHGLIKITADASRLQFAFHTVDNEIIDNVTLSKVV